MCRVTAARTANDRALQRRLGPHGSAAQARYRALIDEQAVATPGITDRLLGDTARHDGVGSSCIKVDW
jgi:hypothetical protein